MTVMAKDETKVVGDCTFGKLCFNYFGFTEYDKAENGLFYALTPCCGASGKGLDGYIGCRRCFQEVDEVYGDCFEWLELNDNTKIGRIANEWFGGDLVKAQGLRSLVEALIYTPTDDENEIESQAELAGERAAEQVLESRGFWDAEQDLAQERR